MTAAGLFFFFLQQDAVLLELKFKPGETTRTTNKVRQQMAITGLGDQKGDSEAEMVLVRTVRSVDAKRIALCAIQYERIRFAIKAPLLIEFDSDKKEDLERAKRDPLLGVFSLLAGKTIPMKIKPTGEVFDADLKDLGQGASGDPALKKAMETGGGFKVFLPEKPVKVGDSWKRSEAMDVGPLKVRVDTTATLKEIKGKTAIISLDAAFKLASEVPGATVAIKNQSCNGSIEFDLEVGDAVSTQVEQRCTIEMQLGGQAVSLVVTQTTCMKSSRP